METKSVIIGGGSGLIGTALCSHLQNRGHSVRILSRSPDKITEYDAYFWNPIEGEIDESVFLNADVIINLAGANIASKRWTEKRKKLILESRISSNLIFKDRLKKSTSIKKYIAASAQGYYGDHDDDILDETSEPTTEGFLSKSTQQWEKAIRNTIPTGMDACIMRNGIVLTINGGPIGELKIPLRLGIVPQFGNGKQYLSWIHIEDIVNIYTACVEEKAYVGVFNVVSPGAATYGEFAKALKKASGTILPIIPIPEFLLKLGLGQMANSLLESVRLRPTRLIELGYKFKYEEINYAVADIIQS